MTNTENSNQHEVKPTSTIKKIIRKESVIEEKSVTLKAEEPKVHYLKLQEFFQTFGPNARTVPELRLCGTWMKNAGFVPKQYVSVTVMDGLLIIRSADTVQSAEK